jgi:hypothetical protein
MKKFFHNNGLSVVLFGFFAFSIIGQAWTGFHFHNQELQDHHQPAISMAAYLLSGDFLESVFENSESEFLQMAMFVLLTMCLHQKGSAESKKCDGPDEVDEDPLVGREKRKNPPKILWKGPVLRKIYENSLSLSLFALFLLSFMLHAHYGAQAFNEEAELHGDPERMQTFSYMLTSRFWFESFQNWQSEFFSVGTLVVLSIYLRQKGSAQSKPVAMAHDEEP